MERVPFSVPTLDKACFADDDGQEGDGWEEKVWDGLVLCSTAFIDGTQLRPGKEVFSNSRRNIGCCWGKGMDQIVCPGSRPTHMMPGSPLTIGSGASPWDQAD